MFLACFGTGHDVKNTLSLQIVATGLCCSLTHFYHTILGN